MTGCTNLWEKLLNHREEIKRQQKDNYEPEWQTRENGEGVWKFLERIMIK